MLLFDDSGRATGRQARQSDAPRLNRCNGSRVSRGSFFVSAEAGAPVYRVDTALVAELSATKREGSGVDRRNVEPLAGVAGLIDYRSNC